MNDESELKDSNETETAPPTLVQSMLRSVVGLSLFAIITAGLIAVTQINTKEQIKQQVKQARAKALLEIVPLSEHNNDMLADSYWLKATRELGLSETAEAFIAKQNGIPHTLILPVIAPDGYSGPIRLIVGIDNTGAIKGVRVIEHKETPGLGDRIDLKKSDWVLGFVNKSLANTPDSSWKVKKDGGDFDQLTGATITPRAIVKAVYKALLYYRDNQALLLNPHATETPLSSDASSK
jgi:H+/Na+-translocating ferredoxin:NAD+ oxidoreductase subunit G